jgi:hypothetical protein
VTSYPASQGTDPGMNYQQIVVVVVMDVLLIAELCVSMYLANQNPEYFTLVFIRDFLIMCIPTLILAKVFVSRLRSKETEVQS